MNEKDVVGIYRDRFINLMEASFGIIDRVLVNQIYDMMLDKRKTLTQFFTSVLFNYLKYNSGLVGNYNKSDLDHLISEFESIIKELKEKRAFCENR